MQCCSKRVSLKLTAHLRGQEPSRGQGRLWIVMRPPRLRWRWKLTPNQHSGWAAQPPSGCAAAHEECTMGVILVGKNSGLSEENLRISLAVRQRCLPPPLEWSATGNFPPLPRWLVHGLSSGAHEESLQSISTNASPPVHIPSFHYRPAVGHASAPSSRQIQCFFLGLHQRVARQFLQR